MDFDLAGKVAIVTGASRGLGRAIAEALAGEGANVLALARSMDGLRELASASPRIRIAPCDVQDLDELIAAPHRAVEQFGRLDIIVNNAGIAPAAPFSEMPIARWEEIFATNVMAPAALVRAAAPILLEQQSGKIINVASTSGLRGKARLVAYSASKGALLRMTEALAAEWARFGVQVNAIAPGAFETDAQSEVLANDELLRRRVRKIPARRMGLPDEAGPMACYLASPLSDFVTGATFIIDGGEASKL